MRVQINGRIYASMTQEPQDDIDSNLLTAASVLMASFSGAFTLDGNIRNVDLLGQHGTALSGQAGYMNQDGHMFRVIELVIPLIINDVFAQIP